MVIFREFVLLLVEVNIGLRCLWVDLLWLVVRYEIFILILIEFIILLSVCLDLFFCVKRRFVTSFYGYDGYARLVNALHNSHSMYRGDVHCVGDMEALSLFPL